MRDINFFEPYDIKHNGDNTKYYYQILTLVLLGAIISTFSINVAQTVILNKEIENYKTELNRSTIKEKIEISEKVTNQLNALTKYEQDLDLVISSIEDRDIVSNILLDEISKSVPKNINFKTMNISYDIISIQAVTTNRQAIAELQYNLKSIDNITDVHVENISGNESVQGEYTFNIKCNLKGGADQSETK